LELEVMSPLAKVFVVVNLVLAVAFFGSSATLFATRVNWRDEAVRFKTEADKALNEMNGKFKAQAGDLQTLSKAHASLNANYANVSADKEKLLGTLQETKTSLAKETLRVDTEVKEKTQLNSRMQSLEGNNTQLGARVDQLTKEAADSKAAEEKARAEFTRIRVDLDKSNDQLEKSLIELASITAKLETAKMELAAAEKQGFRLGTGRAPPIDAIVEAVKGDDKLVVLSVGRDQKVEEGYEFTIYRGDRFVGKVRVTKVYENLAGAQILFTNDGESIQIGDKAATQI
jgi:predicted nuclease with TOPRIM domain